MDVKTRSALRSLKGHKRSCAALRWTDDNLHILSGSNDGNLGYWDISTGECLIMGEECHEDKIKSIALNGIDSNLVTSCSYDKKVIL